MEKKYLQKDSEEQLRVALAEPFSANEIEWRVGVGGSNGNVPMFAYVDARAVRNRLNDVFSVGGWSDSCRTVESGGQTGVICQIRACVGGREVIHEDGSDFTNMEALKGGISGAFKRAATHLGIGEYLYNLPKVQVKKEDVYKVKFVLPDWALPESERKGNDRLQVIWKKDGTPYNTNGGSYSGSKGSYAQNSNKAIPDDVKTAMEVVSMTDGYSKGKKLGQLSMKSLAYLANRGCSETERNSARLVHDFKEQ